MNKLDRIDNILKKIMKTKTSDNFSSKNCLSEELISCYLDNLLNKKEKEDTEKHLLVCERCLDEVILAKKAAKEKPSLIPSKSLTDKAIKLSESKKNIFDVVIKTAKDIISIVETSLDVTVLTRRLAPVSVRGKDDKEAYQSLSFVKNIEGLDLEIEIEKVRDLINLKVRTISKRNKPVKGLMVSLEDEKRELSSAVMENDFVSFEDINPKNYYIKVSKKGEFIGKFSLSLIE